MEIIYTILGAVIMEQQLAHEALDRTYLVMNTFITFVKEHQFISNNAELESLAENIEKSMADLYLKIGAQKEFWDDEKV